MYVFMTLKHATKIEHSPMLLDFTPISKLVSKWNRDLTQDEIDKCFNDERLI